MLSIRQLTYAFPRSNESAGGAVLRGVSFDCAEQTVTCVVGPSGCGKTTLLNLIAGLLAPQAGEVVRDDGGLTTGFVFQTASLIPWLNVMDNALFGAEISRRGPADASKRAMRLFAAYGLNGFEHAYPSALSGGMKQRVAIVRAVLSGAKILLLDEPFSGADIVLRRELQRDVLRLVEAERLTVVMVSHDLEEAVRMGNAVAVLSARPAGLKGIVPIQLNQEERMDRGRALRGEMARYVDEVWALLSSGPEEFRPTTRRGDA